MKMKNIVKTVLEELKKKDLEPTPQNYHYYFCQKAKELNIEINGCSEELSVVSQLLSSEDLDKIRAQKIQDTDKLLEAIILSIKEKEKDLLKLNSKTALISDETIEKIASLMIASLMPSHNSSEYIEEITDFSSKIIDSPHIITTEDIQKSIEYFIQKRKEEDTKIITDTTQKVSDLISSMEKFVTNTLSSNNSSGDELNTALESLQELDIHTILTSPELLEDMKDTLIDINKTMQTKIKYLSDELVKEHSEVESLKHKLKEMENNIKYGSAIEEVDPLTNLFNFNKYRKHIKHLDTIYKTIGKNFYVMLIDLDHFKDINNIYGHEAGNSVLKTFANILEQYSNHNFVAREGGVRFVMVLEQSNHEEAKLMFEKLQGIVLKNKFVYEAIKIKLSFSASFTSRDEFQSLDRMLSRVNELLYKAKNSGRNCCMYK
jgi:diguanylate cyclase (GGDEF)-like protein